MIIKEEFGDLFLTDKKYALVHCISEDCAMGKGIAVEFNKRFPKMKNVLLKFFKENPDKHFPITLLYHSIKEQRNVFNLVTKEKYWQKPTYHTISVCIYRMAEICKERDIKYLAMPLIGCGLDKLKWSKVKAIIENAFKDQDIEILIKRKETNNVY